MSLKIQNTSATGTWRSKCWKEKGKEKKKVRTEKLSCSLCLCWQRCQRWECSSYPNQLELTSSHRAAAHKTTFVQNGYISARPVCPHSSHDNPTASPEAHTGHSHCLVSQVWHRQSSATSPGRDSAEKSSMSSNTTHCSNTLVKNILKGIWASVKSCKPSNIVGNRGNPWHLPGKEWQQVSLSHVSSRMACQTNFLLNFVGFWIFFFYDDALLCLTLGVWAILWPGKLSSRREFASSH